ncbi:MAG: hypothetical protein KDE58_41970, partial [Caldilineaceae bacterium]|nr:hypothetical protein [Caldilineaceae bacterium]
LEGPVDFVLADGPPERVGRAAILPALWEMLAADWELWLDDGCRAHEQACLAGWQQRYEFCHQLEQFDAKGLYRLSARPAPPTFTLPPRLRGHLALSILTGSRLPLLQQTLATLEREAPALLAESTVLVMVNGADAQTAAFVKRLPYVDHQISHQAAIQPIGVATSQLVDRALQSRAIDYLLHLEDDWALRTLDGHWLARAHQILAEQPGVGQVRLRHQSETVLPYHMVTRAPIHWLDQGEQRYAQSAHFTFNPSLIRATDARRIYPCRDERQAQVKFLQMGLATVQLQPGAFHHLGAQQSLRQRLKRH